VLRFANVRRVVPERILSVRILPLVDRTVVAAGNKLGHIGFWDVDGLVEDEEDGDGANGVFQYFPHRGSVGGIVMHPDAQRKVTDFFSFGSRVYNFLIVTILSFFFPVNLRVHGWVV